MKREQHIGEGIASMEGYGFSVVHIGRLRSCFDVLAEKKNRILMLKFVKNIDSMEEDESAALKKLGAFFGAEVMVVGSIRKGHAMEDEVQFTRRGLPCISISSLESVAGGRRMATAERSVRVKYKIDRNLLKRLRKLSGLSIRALAMATGISKDSVYRYERGDSYATYRNLGILESFFGEKLLDDRNDPYGRSTQAYSRSFKRFGAQFVEIEAAPFSIVGKGRFRYEAGVQANSRTMKKRADLYGRIAEVLGGDYPFFMTTGKGQPDRIYGIPAVSKLELDKIEDEGELISLITERAK